MHIGAPPVDLVGRQCQRPNVTQKGGESLLPECINPGRCFSLVYVCARSTVTRANPHRPACSNTRLENGDTAMTFSLSKWSAFALLPLLVLACADDSAGDPEELR